MQMQGSTVDPVVSKYIRSGLKPEAVPFAVANYGDNPTKVSSLSFSASCFYFNMSVVGSW